MSDVIPFYERYPIKEQLLHEGIALCGVIHSKDRLDKVFRFAVHNNDICLVSYPRSGSRWTAEILSWIYYNGNEAKLQEIDNLVRCPFLENDPKRVNRKEDIMDCTCQTEQRLYSTHLPSNMVPRQLTEKGKIIYVLRNPKDCAVSFYHFYRINKVLGPYEGNWDDFFQGFCKGEMLFGSYFDHVKGWWERRKQENILFVKYEEMKRDPKNHIRRIAQFLGKSLSGEEVELINQNTSFMAMQNNPKTNFSRDPGKPFFRLDLGVEFIRKGEIGDWKNYFTVAQNEEFDEIIKDKLSGTELNFIYE